MIDCTDDIDIDDLVSDMQAGIYAIRVFHARIAQLEAEREGMVQVPVETLKQWTKSYRGSTHKREMDALIAAGSQ